MVSGSPACGGRVGSGFDVLLGERMGVGDIRLRLGAIPRVLEHHMFPSAL